MTRAIFVPGPTWAGSGINYGNDRAFAQFYDLQKIRNELRLLRTYFTGIRIFIPHFQYGTAHDIIQHCLAIIDVAVACNFQQIIWGATSSEATLTASTYSNYVAAVTARAAAAQSHGVRTFIVGNEEDYHVDNTTLTKSQIQNHIRTDLYASVKAAFSGTISYNLPAGVLSDWLASGKGALDNLGMNVYGANEYDSSGFCRDVRNFYNAFGTTAYISEYGLHSDWSAVTMDAEQQYHELKKRHDFVRRIGLSAGYFFLYSHLSDDHFAVRLASGYYRTMWQAIVRDRFSWLGSQNRQVYQFRVPQNRP